jgi:hypothetical protein
MGDKAMRNVLPPNNILIPIIVLFVLVLSGLACSGSPGVSSTADQTTAEVQPESASSTADQAEVEIEVAQESPTVGSPDTPKSDGFYSVGSEILPGKWESDGTGDQCYWARLDAQQNTLGNHFGLAGGTVTVLTSDFEVQFRGCGTWHYVENADLQPLDSLSEPRADGFFTVGIEIAPGTWESDGSGSDCYWARLDDKQETIANHFGLAGGSVTILPTDYEVNFRDCGTWRLAGTSESMLAELNPSAPKNDGIYTVGTEILLGKWESDGDGNQCYWERLDQQQNTLGNHFGLAGGTMTIVDSDYEVKVQGCGTWTYVENIERVLSESAKEPKADGFYTVGVEIAPGIWQSDGDGDNCFWQRLNDHQDTIDNHFGLAGGTMAIQPTDYEVQMKDCGTWTIVE